MSEPLPVGTAAARSDPHSRDARTAIAHAAARTGVDFDYLLAQAKLESSLDPQARAGTSSAAGLFQFTNGTWLETLDRHGATHGLGWAGQAIEGGQLRDPAIRSQVMGLRFDADASALMAAELANDNRVALSAQLGREPDATELYLAHFLGIGGATRFLAALANDPGQSAAALLPQAAAANRRIFYDASGAPRSVGDMMALMNAKVAGAMEGDGPPSFASQGTLAWHTAATPPISASQQPNGLVLAARPTMADTLRDTFGLASKGEAPPGVRAAYNRLRSFGL